MYAVAKAVGVHAVFVLTPNCAAKVVCGDITDKRLTSNLVR